MEKEKVKLTKGQKILFLFTIIYMLVFLGLYISQKNYEFITYIIFQTFFIILVAKLHFKYRFSTGLLTGLSLWGFFHMFGGYYFPFLGTKPYEIWFIPNILKYDMVIHCYGFGLATLASYYILKPSLKDGKLNLATTILIVLIGMGLGALNEIVEFSTVVFFNATGVGDYNNNMLDLVFNTIGAIIAVYYLKFVKKV